MKNKKISLNGGVTLVRSYRPKNGLRVFVTRKTNGKHQIFRQSLSCLIDHLGQKHQTVDTLPDLAVSTVKKKFKDMARQTL